MKFITESPNLIVWDNDGNKRLCKFKEGKFETKDEYIIKRLKFLGFKFEEDKEELREQIIRELKEEEVKKVKKR